MERKTIRPGLVSPWLPGPHRSATCQCCGRLVKAKFGKIAHHGYQKIENRYRTASCFGARYLPFEVSRDRLGELIALLHDELKACESMLRKANKARTGKSPDYSCVIQWEIKRHLIKPVGKKKVHKFLKRIVVTQGNFLAAYNANAGAFNKQGMRTFVDMIERNQRYWATECRGLVDTIALQQIRYDKWKPIT